ncbi:FecR family protein [Pedobacter jeongneungensis]|uniref:FecR family protein n=1 Tax=Pedobacter jeongneungensis TaxID=947309 RepID=UPI0004695FF9|nr:FecR domain-containing protein [Pedobacter jeongneungensis]
MEKRPLSPGLFERFLANKSNAAELEQLFEHFGEVDQQELEKLIKLDFEQDAMPFDVAEEGRLALIHAGLSEKLFAKPESRILKVLKSNRFIRVAAAILVVISVSLMIARFFNSNHGIVPGSAKAMLSLGGRETVLDGKKDSVLYRSKGVTVNTKADGTMIFMAVNADSVEASKLNTLSTPNGGEYRVTLSDGSVVMLNAGSKLSFPTDFRGSERKVYVEGEAFFKVAKNPLKPFIVNVAGNEIKVLGTQFNVSSYPEDEGTEATLLEGSIQFTNGNGDQVVLKPDQQVISHHGKLDLQNVSAEDFNAWTKGEFLFNDVPLSTVMQKLGRWYNVEVDVKSIPQKNLYLKISRKADIDEVLDAIATATDYRLKIKENKIVFKE